jgi:hypothetical protein
VSEPGAQRVSRLRRDKSDPDQEADDDRWNPEHCEDDQQFRRSDVQVSGA